MGRDADPRHDQAASSRDVRGGAAVPLTLPPTRFEYYRICERTVHFDGYIEVDSAYYSAPPRYVGRKVVVHVGRLWLRIVDRQDARCVREHPIALHKGQRRTNDASAQTDAHAG